VARIYAAPPTPSDRSGGLLGTLLEHLREDSNPQEDALLAEVGIVQVRREEREEEG